MVQLVLGRIDFWYFLAVSVVEISGALVGSLIVYVMYADQFKLSEKDIDPVIVRNIFLNSTGNSQFTTQLLR